MSAEICVHGDGAILAPPILLPFTHLPLEQHDMEQHDTSDSPSSSAGFSSTPERKWSEFPLDLQLRIADLPPDSKLIFSLFAMTGAFSTTHGGVLRHAAVPPVEEAGGFAAADENWTHSRAVVGGS